MLEAYQAYADYDTMLRLTRELIQEAAIAAYGSATARRPGTDEEFDISGDWPVKTVNEAISEALGEEVTADTDIAALHTALRQGGDPVRPEVEPRRRRCWRCTSTWSSRRPWQPTFYKDFPTEVSPLTRQHRVRPAAGRALGPGRASAPSWAPPTPS